MFLNTLRFSKFLLSISIFCYSRQTGNIFGVTVSLFKFLLYYSLLTFIVYFYTCKVCITNTFQHLWVYYFLDFVSKIFFVILVLILCFVTWISASFRQTSTCAKYLFSSCILISFVFLLMTVSFNSDLQIWLITFLLSLLSTVLQTLVRCSSFPHFFPSSFLVGLHLHLPLLLFMLIF